VPQGQQEPYRGRSTGDGCKRASSSGSSGSSQSGMFSVSSSAVKTGDLARHEGLRCVIAAPDNKLEQMYAARLEQQQVAYAAELDRRRAAHAADLTGMQRKMDILQEEVQVRAGQATALREENQRLRQLVSSQAAVCEREVRAACTLAGNVQQLQACLEAATSELNAAAAESYETIDLLAASETARAAAEQLVPVLRCEALELRCQLQDAQMLVVQMGMWADTQAAELNKLAQQAVTDRNIKEAAMASIACLDQQVDVATGLVHAVLVAMGTPLTCGVSLPGGLQLLPTTISPMLKVMAPLVADVIGDSSKWGAELVRLCAINSRMAMQSLA
jgi:hypothetical protein